MSFNYSNLENFKQMKEVQENKPLRTPHAYKELVFINDSSERNALLGKIKNINIKLKRLDNNFIDEIIQIGKEALHIKKVIENYHICAKKKFSLETCYKYIFKKEIRRINEYIAIYLSTEQGSDKNIPLTVNIKLGQALNSKDDDRRKTAERIIESKCLKNGKPLSQLTIKDIQNEFKPVKISCSKSFNSTKIKALELKRSFKELKKLINEEQIKHPEKGNISLGLEELLQIQNQTLQIIKEIQNKLIPTATLKTKKKDTS